VRAPPDRACIVRLTCEGSGLSQRELRRRLPHPSFMISRLAITEARIRQLLDARNQ